MKTQAVGEWDQIHSTYWWKGIFLPGNTSKTGFFKGYSKKYGHNEAADKDYLLVKKVMMLNEHGYIDKCSEIKIHERVTPYCKADNPVVVTLYPDRYEIAAEGITKANIYQSLKAIYEERAGAGKNQYMHVKPSVINASTDAQVKAAETKSYASLDHLMSELHRLKSIGVPDGLIQATYKKIMDVPRNQRLR
jgi:hypothetical protein